MAKAIVTGIEQSYFDNGSPRIQVGIIYGGVDVPGTYQKRGAIVDISGVTTLSDLSTAITTAVRAQAVNNGYTVGANLVFLPSFSAT